MVMLYGGTPTLGRQQDENCYREGTIGVFVKSRAGHRAFITAGHAVGKGLESVFLMNNDRGRGLRLGVVIENVYLVSNQSDDVAIVGLLDAVDNDKILPWTVAFWGPKDTMMTRKLEGIAPRPAVNAKVMVAGAKTNLHAGKVVSRRVTVNDGSSGRRFVDVIELKMETHWNRGPIPGDSGGPVFHGNNLVGIAVQLDRTDETKLYCVSVDRFLHLITNRISHRWL